MAPTSYRTLIEPDALGTRLDDPSLVVVDCRFSLQDTAWGRGAYREAHIPGAVYAHLDDDLSGTVRPGATGRHPLPPVDVFSETLGGWGIGDGVQVVAYDDRGGAIAARLWWMLRWLGHEHAAVLDGGWPAWVARGLPARSGPERNAPRRFEAHPRDGLAVDVAQVDRLRMDPAWRLIDARTAERYRGEEEPIDPVAGHIPGALSAPYPGNVDDAGRMLPPEAIRRRYQPLLGGVDASHVVCYCGSGVTAAHDVLAIEHAGLGQALLYPGSWSEWITDPDRPVARDA